MARHHEPAVLLVYIAQLLFKFGDLFVRNLSELFINNEQQKVPVLHDLHFKLYTFVFVSHGIYSLVF